MMNKLFSIVSLITILSCSVISQAQTIYSVTDVYTDPSIHDWDTINVAGYYTTPEDSLLIYFYGYWDRDEALPPYNYLVTTGTDVPPEAWNGGYIIAYGIVHFETNPEPYHPEDSLKAYLNILNLSVLIDGEQSQKGSTLPKEKIYNKKDRDDCDSCKFAVLISGGINSENNHEKYWENLVALYDFKVNHENYCPENIFVHYYHGIGRDNRIPQARITIADSAHIAQSHEEISRRVAKCTREGKKSTFQKMVTNHGDSDGTNGTICLLGEEELNPADLRTMQQQIIDSCCSLVYDEFLQCYGGYCVDSMKELDALNKATIYINSNADHESGYSPDSTTHPYLAAKINALNNGEDYEDAVVKAKLAYDDYLCLKTDHAHDMAQTFRNNMEFPFAEINIFEWIADSIERINAICKSRNVIIRPMKQYCQWDKYVVPPHGQLILNFKDDSIISCGNVTVYKEDSLGHKIKVKVWNWNVEGSYRYEAGNEQRVINGDSATSTTFWIHDDDSQFVITSEAKGNHILDESPSNEILYPGFSFGGRDQSGSEFGELIGPYYQYDNIDELGLDLKELPAIMGPDIVSDFKFTFNVEQDDEFWTDMELYLEIAQVFNPDTLYVICDEAENPYFKLPITEPGVYTAHLGDMTFGKPLSMITLNTPVCSFEFDSWGLRSLYEPASGIEKPPVPVISKEHHYMEVIPNPFEQGFYVYLNLPQTGTVSLSLFDISGKQVATLYNKEVPDTKVDIYYDGRNASGQPLNKGVYILKLTLNGQILETVKTIRIR